PLKCELVISNIYSTQIANFGQESPKAQSPKQQMPSYSDCLGIKRDLRWKGLMNAVARFVQERLILWLIFGLALTATAASTNSTNSSWYSRFWQTDDGLRNNIVTAIAQTQDGFLWVGTPAGLARFDGDQFREFIYQSEGINGHPSVHTLQSAAKGG